MPERTLDDLKRDLRSWRPSRFQTAAQALGESGDPAAEPALLQALHDCLEGSLVLWHRTARFQAVAAALVSLRTPDAVEPFTRALNDQDVSVRNTAIEALAELADPRAVGPLLRIVGEVQMLSDEPAAEALARLGHGLLVPVMRALRNHYGLGVAYWADKAAREARVVVGNEAAVSFLADERALGTLIRALAGSDANAYGAVRRYVLDAWVALGADAAARLLHLLQHEDSTVQLWAGEALGRLGDAGMVPALLDLVARGERRVHLPAAVALGFLGEPRALRTLLRALESDDHDVVRAAAAALGPMGAAAAEALEPLRRPRKEAVPFGELGRVCRASIRQIEAGLRTAPAELEAALAPEGRGTELEATRAPAGRGTEPEAVG